MNKCLGKTGFFRANINGSRVNCSCRTVITPNPYLDCNQVICPKTIAEIITVPVRINSENYQYIQHLVDNYPNYPCVLSINNSSSKKNFKIGDIAFRQVMDNDICLSNRYPSVREESFGGSRVKISETEQSIQYNLSVVSKFNADFDGDEMQLFFLPAADDNLEVALLSSVYQQFIQYTSFKNVVGGAKDLATGIYNIQHITPEVEKLLQIKPQDIIQQIIDGIDDYDDGDIVIENGKLKEYNKSIADSESKFLTDVAFKYGTAKAIQIINTVIKTCYKVNEAMNYSLYYNLFNTSSKSQQQYEDERIKSGSKLLEKYYSGKFATPLGVEPNKFFQQCLDAQLSLNEDIQNKIIQLQYTGQGFNNLFNKDVEKVIIPFHKALISIGECGDDEGSNLINMPRLFWCYPKFSTDIRNQGYSIDKYMDGVSATTNFLIAYEGRHQAYVKGNVIRDSGYMQRRIQKAFDNVYSGYNSIIYGNGHSIIELQHGQSSYDPRWYQIIIVKRKSNWSAEQNEIFDQIKQQENQIHFDNQEDEIRFALPFKPDQKEITQEELQAILSCRITNNMSEEFQKIQYQQSWYFWAYCFLTMDISKKQPTYNIVQQYIRSILSPGDSIGLKSAMAITGPLSQDTLNAIHHTKSSSGRIQYTFEDKLSGPQRFLELTQGQCQYIQFSCELLDKSEDFATKFIQNYQTLKLSKLKPQIDLYFQQKQWYLQINLDFQILAYNNISLQILIDQLLTFLKTKKVIIQKQKNQIILQFIFSISVNENLLTNYRLQLQDTFEFGSKILYNAFYQEKNGKITIHGNLHESTLQQIYYIKEININTIQVNSIPFYYSLFGIFKADNKLYNEYVTTVDSIGVTKGLNKAFHQMFSSTQCQTGRYTGFSRFDYKKDLNRGFLQNIIYEEGKAFLIEAAKHQQWYSTNTFQDTQLFGTKGRCGTNIADYYL